MFKKIIISLSTLFIISSGLTAADKNTITVDYSEFSNRKVWEAKIKEGKENTKVLADADLKVDVLRMRSNQASFYFQKKVNVNLNTHGQVSWKWKVRRHPLGGDVRKRSTDDQAIQVLFAFEGRNVISYIWDPTAPKGHIKDSSIPFVVSQKVYVLQSGNKKDELNKWFTISRDIKADYKKLFGKNAPKLAGVAIQINSQHTESYCESLISPITFNKK